MWLERLLLSLIARQVQLKAPATGMWEWGACLGGREGWRIAGGGQVSTGSGQSPTFRTAACETIQRTSVPQREPFSFSALYCFKE